MAYLLAVKSIIIPVLDRGNISGTIILIMVHICSRKELMKISQKMLRNLLPDYILTSIGLPDCWHLAKTVGRFYCTPMTIAGKCPMVCDECRSKFEGIADKMAEDKTTIRNPMGVFIYKLRNLVNDAVEVQPKPKIAKKDAYGIPVDKEGNVWDTMLANL